MATKFPLCEQLGVLRSVTTRNGSRKLVVSTAALHEALGWPTYEKYLPYMEQSGYNAGVTPESCEEFLRTLEGE